MSPELDPFFFPSVSLPLPSFSIFFVISPRSSFIAERPYFLVKSSLAYKPSRLAV
jgi:hypothetical protein